MSADEPQLFAKLRMSRREKSCGSQGGRPLLHAACALAARHPLRAPAACRPPPSYAPHAHADRLRARLHRGLASTRRCLRTHPSNHDEQQQQHMTKKWRCAHAPTRLAMRCMSMQMYVHANACPCDACLHTAARFCLNAGIEFRLPPGDLLLATVLLSTSSLLLMTSLLAA
jgi:hypothetical protein